jgi:hypothetical protein
MRAHLYVSAVAVLLGLLAPRCETLAAEVAQPSSKATRSNPKELERRAAETVEQALLAEADEQPAERAALLKQAVELAPGYAPARWQAGLVRWQGKWQSVEAVTEAAARDPQRVAYAALRAQQALSAEAERELAQWCLKHKLDVEFKYHLRKLLEFTPDDPIALHELGLHAYEGELLTKPEIAARKKEAESRQHGLSYWKPRLTAWRRDLNDTDEAKRDEALSQIRAITDVEVIGAFEAVLAESDPAAKTSEFSREMIGVLGRMQDARATFALVREAVLSQWPDAQEAAVAELKRHELTDYVPYTLGNMLTLYESKYVMTVAPNGTVHYEQRLKRQHADSDDVGLRKTEVVPAIGIGLGAMARNTPAGVLRDDQYALDKSRPSLERHKRFAAREARWNAFKDALNLAALDEAVVGELNRITEDRNAAIRRLLVVNTGTDQGEDPHAWWGWWTNYNELNYSPERRVNYYESESTYYDYVHYNGAGHFSSCFIAGTPVWTLTGARAIENIQPGDRVLAEDPQTGELAFKTVLQTTIRPPSPTRKLQIGDELIVATRGHRFWQVGRGWQMAKQLEPPAMLHGVGGALPLEIAEDGEDAEAHNLVVADFHTYFVGKNRTLVHDNSAPRPLLGSVPGLVQNEATATPAAAKQ